MIYFFQPLSPSACPRHDHSVKLKVNKMTSAKTLMPVDYYRLPLCRPEGDPKMYN
jgi:hypothetical protein